MVASDQTKNYVQDIHEKSPFLPIKIPSSVESTAFDGGINSPAPLPDWLSFRPCQRAYPPLDPGAQKLSQLLYCLVVEMMVGGMPFGSGGYAKKAAFRTPS
jgi:hypothetical protein